MSFSRLSKYLEIKKQQYLSRAPIDQKQIVVILNKYLKEELSLMTVVGEHQIVIQGSRIKILYLSGTTKQFLHPYNEDIRDYINAQSDTENKITSLLLS